MANSFCVSVGRSYVCAALARLQCIQTAIACPPGRFALHFQPRSKQLKLSLNCQDGNFPRTRHSVVVAAQGDDPAARSRAIEAITAAYWKPLYKYVEEARLLSISQGKFVNEYVEQDGSADGKTLILVSERIENIADGWRARQTYKFVNQHKKNLPSIPKASGNG